VRPIVPGPLSRLSSAAFFSADVAKENEALLPALLADDQVDLSVLVSELHQLTEGSTP
jgi:hypothetical protein